MAMLLEGERLREARRYNRLSITELAKKLGVTKQSVSKYEHNESQPSVDVYQKIVTSLKFPVRFFQESDDFSYSDRGTFYRSRLTSTQSEKKPSELLKKYFSVVIDYFSQYVDFPSLNEIDLFDSPSSAANYLREVWNLGDEPIPNMMELLESHGFFVASVHPNSEKVDAFSSLVKIDSRKYYTILLDQQHQTFFKQQFSLAHELGHWILHSYGDNPQELDSVSYRVMEKEANEFAALFLLPRSSFYPDAKMAGLSLDAFVDLKSKWHVSASSMIFRANEVGLFSSSEYLRLQKRISSRGWRKEEPFDFDTPQMQPSILREAFELMRKASLVRKGDFARQLDRIYHICLPTDILSEITCIPANELTDSETKKIINIKTNLPSK